MSVDEEMQLRLQQFDQNNNNYSKISVLVISWMDDDLGVDGEVNQVSTLFRDVFHFEVRQFVIPSTRSESALGAAVSNFVHTFGGEETLLIIYYGGHGDPDTRGQRQAVWAAKRTGGPSLQWYNIQPILSSSEGDILLLLDCCHAGQAARDRSDHTIELLAAAAMNLITPGPKDRHKSFTSVMISEAQDLSKNPGGFLVTELEGRMRNKDLGLVQQPYHTLIAGSNSGSIRLKPMQTGTVKKSSTARLPHTELGLRLSLFEEPDASDKAQILRWITTHRPSSISVIQIEEVFVRARAVQRTGQHVLDVSDSHGRAAGVATVEPSSGRPLTDNARTDIRARLKILQDELAAPVYTDNADSDTVLNAITSLEMKRRLLCEALEDCISDLGSRQLLELSSSEDAQAAGVSNLVDANILLSTEIELINNDLSGRVIFEMDDRQSKSKWRLGQLQSSPVLVEYWYYDAESCVGETSPRTISSQVNKISRLLSRIESNSFRTLPSCGYVHEQLYTPRFGMVYKIPEVLRKGSWCSLRNAIKSIRCVSLDRRRKLAHMISSSLLHFHIVGWMHKGFHSANILLPRLSKSASATEQKSSIHMKQTDLDFNEPYVCGFDYARANEAESWLTSSPGLEINIYRHPERWNKPLRFQRKHDIYALGILLLEIGLWKEAGAMDPHNKGFRTAQGKPDTVAQTFLTLAGDNLAHRAGDTFAAATRFCLAFEPPENAKQCNSSTLKLLRGEVVDRLA